MVVRFDTNTLHDRRRRAVVDLLVRVYDIIERGPGFLSESDVKELGALPKFLLGAYFALASAAIEKSERSWKATPKFHAFQHLCEIQNKTMNPRCFWAYSDEDLQRHLGDIAGSCSSMRLDYMVLYKWVILTFEDDDAE